MRSFGSLSCHGHTGWLRHCGHACSSSRQSQGKLLSVSSTSSGPPRIHKLVVIHLILMSSLENPRNFWTDRIFKSHFTDNFKSPFPPDCVKGTPTGNFHKQNGEIWGGTWRNYAFSTFDFPLIPSIFPTFSEVFPRVFSRFPQVRRQRAAAQILQTLQAKMAGGGAAGGGSESSTSINQPIIDNGYH